MFRHLFPIRFHGQPVHLHIGPGAIPDAEVAGADLLAAIRKGHVDAGAALELASALRQLASDVEVSVGPADGD